MFKNKTMARYVSQVVKCLQVGDPDQTPALPKSINKNKKYRI
jgi:hypothetical protein